MIGSSSTPVIPSELLSRLRSAPILPIVRVGLLSEFVATVDRLVAGGAQAIEILLRSPDAPAAISLCRTRYPNLLVGAGTVLSSDQLCQAMAVGAQFAISPGFESEIVQTALSHRIEYIPGIQTASEAMAAYRSGFRLVKYYHAEASNGAIVVEDFQKIFPEMQFICTGKIGERHSRTYASLRGVAGIGTSWVHSQGDPDAIADRYRKAVEDYRTARSNAGILSG
jgi:2-dehydro-3-deoxyphosphogluconate aldolase/(4S)-4-hydroxy-2-oxoglutarate aldolase